jgi:hypothetical protein
VHRCALRHLPLHAHIAAPTENRLVLSFLAG